MLPTLSPGDRLVVMRRRRLRNGDIVAARDPRDGRLLVKRVAGIDAGGAVTLSGDNPAASTDSRHFGAVARSSIVGRVVYRYAPPARAGRIRSSVVPSPEMARIDDLLAPSYLEGLTSIPIDELRSRRSDCQTVEGSLSYLRRLVQGRLDIVLAELHRRQEGGESSDLSSIIDQLPEILSEKVRSTGNARPPTSVEPAEIDPELVARIDGIADGKRLGSLPDLTDDDIHRLSDELANLERELSAQRRALHERIDALQEELVRRYKTGEASVDSLLK